MRLAPMRVIAHFARWLVGLVPAETQTTPAERACLVHHAAGCRRLVEIGVWHGVTTAALRAAMASDGMLYAVDPFPRGGSASASSATLPGGKLVGSRTGESPGCG